MSDRTFMIRGKAYYFGREPRTSKAYPDKKPSFQLTLTDIPEKEKESFKANLKKYKVKKTFRDDTEKGELVGKEHFTFDRVAFLDEDGKVQNYPLVVDKYADEIPRTTLIGNGSDVIVEYRFRPYTSNTGKEAHTVQLMGVQVVNLVPYSSQTNNFKPLAKKEDSDLEDEEAAYNERDSNNRRSNDAYDDDVPF